MINAIETSDLTRRFDKLTAVEALSLTIPAGTVFGFLGPNGAGKTTTVRMLTALIAPSGGGARVAGYTLGREDQQIRRVTGILTETPGLYERLTAVENLVFFARLYGLSPQRAVEQAEHYLRLLDLWERRNERVSSFSKGMRQKVAIARTLLHEPRVLFLDEPTSGLDPEAARVVLDCIKALRSEGRTIFLTTHNLPEADEVCDLIGIFRTRLLRVDTPHNLRVSLFGNGTRVRVVGAAVVWLEALKTLNFVQDVSVKDDTLFIALDDPDAQNPLLVRQLIEAGAQIRAVEPMAHSLEEVYRELLGAESRQQQPLTTLAPR